jgi:hypothetical protein
MRQAENQKCDSVEALDLGVPRSHSRRNEFSVACVNLLRHYELQQSYGKKLEVVDVLMSRG